MCAPRCAAPRTTTHIARPSRPAIGGSPSPRPGNAACGSPTDFLHWGSVLYPLNARESHLHMLAYTGCRAVVVAEKYAPEIEGVRGDLPDLAPISHGSGYLFTPIWLAGGRNVMVEKFDPATLPDLMIEERTAYMFVVPTILNAINRIPGIEQRLFPISNACWWRPRRSPTKPPSRPTRSSGTPCIRATARPRYYL